MGLGRAKNNGAQPALSEFAQAGESNGPFAGVWLARALREHGTRKDPAHRKALYQGKACSCAEKLNSFEGAQLQLCRKNCRRSPALAAEGWFFSLRRTFSASWSAVPKSPRKRRGVTPAETPHNPTKKQLSLRRLFAKLQLGACEKERAHALRRSLARPCAARARDA
jgi:hypothetical protein